jgi:hypothetical protein
MERKLVGMEAGAGRHAGRSATVLFWGGVAFTASGLFHVLVWLAAGMPALAGPVSWRKPIVFGLSTGVLTLSLAWVTTLLPQTRRLRRQALVFVALLVAELALIDMQQWRGVGSHFNNATPFDGAVFTAMGVLITIAAAIIAVWTWALFRPAVASPHLVSSARAGMVLLNIGNAIGMFIAAWGAAQLAAGLPPNVFGAAGQLKVPHAVALHGVQVLPLVAWLATGSIAPLRTVRLATLGYLLVLAFTIVQTLTGRAPADVTIGSATIAVAGVLLLGWAMVTALARRQTRWGMLAGWSAARLPAPRS